MFFWFFIAVFMFSQAFWFLHDLVGLSKEFFVSGKKGTQLGTVELGTVNQELVRTGTANERVQWEPQVQEPSGGNLDFNEIHEKTKKMKILEKNENN